MVKIELLELTENVARYKYFPESSEEYGIVTLNRKTGQGEFEKLVRHYMTSYAAHALKQIAKYQQNGDFLQKDIIMWY